MKVRMRVRGDGGEAVVATEENLPDHGMRCAECDGLIEPGDEYEHRTISNEGGVEIVEPVHATCLPPPPTLYELDEVVWPAIRAVAEAHQAEAEGYGECAFDEATGTVYYVCGDWTDPEPIERDMLAIPGVEAFVYDFEGMPDGWCSASLVYPDSAAWLTSACQDASSQEEAQALALARLALPTRQARPTDFQSWRDRDWEGHSS